MLIHISRVPVKNVVFAVRFDVGDISIHVIRLIIE